jgi:chromosome partitioning protein
MAVVVALVSQKGGTGESTLARALGAVVAHAGLKVRIADLDPRQHTIVAWGRTRGESGVAPGVDVRGFATVAQALAGLADDELLILDAPAGASRRMLDIAMTADLVVQPSNGSLDDLRPAVIFFHGLAEAGIPHERLVVALSRTLTRAEEEAARAYIDKAGYEVLAGAIPERAAYREAHDRGQAVTEAKRRAVDDQVDRLIEALCDKVHTLMLAKARQAKAAERKKRHTT